MRYREFIVETPLPPDWDKDVYKQSTTFKKRIEYAISKAQKLGKGTSRTAVVIDYEGRPTVLKIAHSKKGVAQNTSESQMLQNKHLLSLGITIPLIDYDKENPQPLWIHTERAQKVSEKQLCNIIKCPSLDVLISYASYVANGEDVSKMHDWLQQKMSDNDLKTFLHYAKKLVSLSKLFVLNISDLGLISNWGLYNGNNPVIIDLGFTESVASDYYGFRR